MKRSFTLLEVLVVLVILGIILTTGIPLYQNAVENSRAQECEVNLKALKNGLDMYLMENDTMPATLSQIPPDIMERAYAAQLAKAPLWFRAGYMLRQWGQRSYAYAQTFLRVLSRGDLKMVSCPSDRTPPVADPAYISYGINSALANRSAKAYHDLAADTPVIADCESATFGSYEHRHRGYGFFGSRGYAQVVLKDGTVTHEGGTASGGGTGSTPYDPCIAKSAYCKSVYTSCQNQAISEYNDCVRRVGAENHDMINRYCLPQKYSKESQCGAEFTNCKGSCP